MRVLVLGGTGFIGRTIAAHLRDLRGIDVVVGARNSSSVPGAKFVPVDATDPDSLAVVFADIDVVVNCVTGSANTIRDNADAMVVAAENSDRPVYVIHLSSMAVYGSREGILDDSTPVSEGFNWYGKAKAGAERKLRQYADAGGSFAILRIGCVYGANSSLWVDRVGLLLKNGRLGDLGEMADGWSNLVHKNDVAKAVVLSVNGRNPGGRVYNLSAPDSPRWNRYFADFALAINSVPLRYKTRLSMLIESRLFAPPLKVFERLANRGPIKVPYAQSIPPSLLRLWRQQIRLDSKGVERELGLTWTAYEEGLSDSVSYFKNKYGC